MIIYNVTTKIANSVKQPWLEWLRDEHIPDIINTGCFTHALILYLLESDDEEGITYAVQYYANNKEDYERYIEQFSTIMRKKAMDKWGDQFISFRTIMEVVH
jgi:hypothetical protein